ncbi:ATP-binding cassette domain-containing protein [Mycobacterium marinum]|uniref:ATP-binding cassette domain-containing protein n=1 Tax=Mycobacterium marinum TaxID=1781 RepID=UPI001921EFB3|nr:ATP-binding cassette domain-containing protein [Mycobacterium marinum]QQW35642.1 ATP-binding cassette domain-containing protein [Mycobacterium marinum]
MIKTDLAVEVRGIHKAFDKVVALDDVGFDVAYGEVIGLLGPNGAGKTTIVDILSTLMRPDSGSAAVAGYNVVSDPAGVRRSIMVTGQQVAVDNLLTGEQNLVLFGRLYGLRKSAARNRAQELLQQFDLVHAAERPVRTYSGGMRRRIDIACGLVVQPRVAFLDEPTTGLDPRSRQSIWRLVASFKKLGIATVLTTQYLEEADALTDRIVLIDQGKVITTGTASELKHRVGDSFCEIVPKDIARIDSIVAAVDAMLPAHNRASLKAESDRVIVPAPHGVNTLIEAARRMAELNIDLADLALRRPSLDDVFLSLTANPSESLSVMSSGVNQ